MSITVLDDIKGSELSTSLLKKIKGKPNQRFRITIETKIESDSKTSKWKDFVKEIDEESPLDGASERVTKLFRDFRNNCSF
ncbi:MAG: hypothetical protein ACMUIP_07665 [bacterium]